MSGAEPAPTSQSTPAHSTGPLAYAVVDLFIGWSKIHRPGRTAEWYQNHLESFLNSLPDRWTLAVESLKPFHVSNWADAHPRWGPNHRRGAITAVQRAFTWAVKMGHIAKSPVRGVDKPPPKRREQVLTRAEFNGLLARASDDQFRDLLTFCWETGSRVQEVRLIEGRHLRLDRGRVELPPAESKGKKRWRYIYLTPASEQIVAGLCARHPSGPLFRNEDGNKWDAQAFNNRFCRLQQRLGREELKRRGWELDPQKVAALAATLPPTYKTGGKTLAKSQTHLIREARKKLTVMEAVKHGTKYALTAIRHSFATRLLESGVDHLTVAALLGHADGSMLAKVYSHLGQRTDFLREELLRASAAGASAGAA